jgi:hypothetical protein
MRRRHMRRHMCRRHVPWRRADCGRVCCCSWCSPRCCSPRRALCCLPPSPSRRPPPRAPRLPCAWSSPRVRHRRFRATACARRYATARHARPSFLKETPTPGAARARERPAAAFRRPRSSRRPCRVLRSEERPGPQRDCLRTAWARDAVSLCPGTAAPLSRWCLLLHRVQERPRPLAPAAGPASSWPVGLVAAFGVSWPARLVAASGASWAGSACRRVQGLWVSWVGQACRRVPSRVPSSVHQSPGAARAGRHAASTPVRRDPRRAQPCPRSFPRSPTS